ncbi:substrate-binding domain-containing protein [Alphaproteobacteria bacterium LSUCC0684]
MNILKTKYFRAGLMLGVVMALGLPFTYPVFGRDFLLLQSATTTQNSGLYDVILPEFTADTGIPVRVVAVGTGQALRNARNCDADVLLVHDYVAEEIFIKNGYGAWRRKVMFNDFVLIGPEDDPAGVADAATIADAFDRIIKKKAKFVSRGDDSGTHKAERRIWADLGKDPEIHSGDWYLEIGNGMGTAINFALETQSYILSDRATWTALRNKSGGRILFAGDPVLHNQYSVIPISVAHCPEIEQDKAEAFAAWILSPRGQMAIASYQRDGVPLFIPNAAP